MERKIEDRELLDAYMRGFRDELQAVAMDVITGELPKKAYLLGREAALLGDDLRSMDAYTDVEILELIRKAP